MTAAEEFAAFLASTPRRAVELPFGATDVWDLGEGPPVLLLHGIAASRRLFFRLAPLLAERHRVIVPLLRGEERPVARMTLGETLDDVAALLERLDLREARLFGISYGGYLALAYSVRNDPRVASVIAQGGFARFPLRAGDRIAAALAPLVPGTLGSAYFAWRTLRGRETPFLEGSEPGLGALNAAWCRATPFRSLVARIRVMTRNDIGPALAAARAPATIVHGSRDAVVPPARFEELRRLLPAARAELWPDLGHTLALTHPARLAALVG